MDLYVFPSILTICKSDFVRLERDKSGRGGYLYYKKEDIVNHVVQTFVVVSAEQYLLCEQVLQKRE